MKYRADIDGLRAIAVLLIVLFHMGLTALSGGFVGVDVFFVISGYLITTLLITDIEAKRFSYGNFYMRRLRRLAPSLLVTLAGTLIVGWLTLAPSHFEELGKSTYATIISLSNVLFWMQTGYFDLDGIYKPLLHTWSLAVEEQFYLIWPTLLVLAAMRLSRQGIAWALGVMSVISLIASEMMLDRDASASFYLMPFRIYEFGFGAMLGLVRLRPLPAGMSHGVSVIGAGLIVLAGLTFSEETHFPGVAALVPTLGAALVILAGPQAIINRAIAWQPIRYIGMISYSLYLVHWPLLVFYAYRNGPPNSMQEVVILTLAATILGALLYHAVETPFRRRDAAGFKISGRAVRRGSLAVGLGVLVLGILVDEKRITGFFIDPEKREQFAMLSRTKAIRDEEVRDARCHYSTRSRSDFLDDLHLCFPENLNDAIVVFGDSHASDIYMGIKRIYPDLPVVQLTTAGCGLSVDHAPGSQCARIYDFTAEWLQDHKDQIGLIIYSQIAGATPQFTHNPNFKPDPARIADFKSEVQRFSPEGVPFYYWGPRVTYETDMDVALLSSPSIIELQDFYAGQNLGAYERLDTDLAALFSDTEIQYLSTIRAFCDLSCPVLTPDQQIVFVDRSHWSPWGAHFAVETVLGANPELARFFSGPI